MSHESMSCAALAFVNDVPGSLEQNADFSTTKKNMTALIPAMDIQVFVQNSTQEWLPLDFGSNSVIRTVKNSCSPQILGCQASDMLSFDEQRINLCNIDGLCVCSLTLHSAGAAPMHPTHGVDRRKMEPMCSCDIPVKELLNTQIGATNESLMRRFISYTYDVGSNCMPVVWEIKFKTSAQGQRLACNLDPNALNALESRSVNDLKQKLAHFRQKRTEAIATVVKEMSGTQEQEFIATFTNGQMLLTPAPTPEQNFSSAVMNVPWGVVGGPVDQQEVNSMQHASKIVEHKKSLQQNLAITAQHQAPQQIDIEVTGWDQATQCMKALHLGNARFHTAKMLEGLTMAMGLCMSKEKTTNVKTYVNSLQQSSAKVDALDHCLLDCLSMQTAGDGNYTPDSYAKGIETYVEFINNKAVRRSRFAMRSGGEHQQWPGVMSKVDLWFKQIQSNRTLSIDDFKSIDGDCEDETAAVIAPFWFAPMHADLESHVQQALATASSSVKSISLDILQAVRCIKARRLAHQIASQKAGAIALEAAPALGFAGGATQLNATSCVSENRFKAPTVREHQQYVKQGQYGGHAYNVMKSSRLLSSYNVDGHLVNVREVMSMRRAEATSIAVGNESLSGPVNSHIYSDDNTLQSKLASAEVDKIPQADFLSITSQLRCASLRSQNLLSPGNMIQPVIQTPSNDLCSSFYKCDVCHGEAVVACAERHSNGGPLLPGVIFPTSPAFNSKVSTLTFQGSTSVEEQKILELLANEVLPQYYQASITCNALHPLEHTLHPLFSMAGAVSVRHTAPVDSSERNTVKTVLGAHAFLPITRRVTVYAFPQNAKLQRADSEFN